MASEALPSRDDTPLLEIAICRRAAIFMPRCCLQRAYAETGRRRPKWPRRIRPKSAGELDFWRLRLAGTAAQEPPDRPLSGPDASSATEIARVGQRPLTNIARIGPNRRLSSAGKHKNPGSVRRAHSSGRIPWAGLRPVPLPGRERIRRFSSIPASVHAICMASIGRAADNPANITCGVPTGQCVKSDTSLARRRSTADVWLAEQCELTGVLRVA